MIRIRFKGFIAAGCPKATSQFLHGTPLGTARTLRYGETVKYSPSEFNEWPLRSRPGAPGNGEYEAQSDQMEQERQV
jgi:hypothetical protein